MTAIVENTAATEVVQAAEAVASGARLVMMDPRLLRVATNVRSELDITPKFQASIALHGVLVPIIAIVAEDGTVDVLMGQRRTVASVEAGLAEVPVYLSKTLAEADRIAQQIVENDMRTALTEGDRAEGYQQMALLGVSAADIAEQTGAKEAHVEGALKAKSTKSGTKALHDGYTVDQALVLAEFDGDEEATAELETVIADNPGGLDHKVQELRDERAAQEEMNAFIAQLEAEGKIIVEKIGHYADDEVIAISSLNRADGSTATDEDANAVRITTNYWGEVNTVLGVTGWNELGFTPKHERHNGGTQAQPGPLTEEEKEEKKEERRTLIANNKAMISATTVRRAWVKTLLSRKQAPKGWQHFTVHAITHHSETASGYEGKVAAEMIGAKFEDSEKWGWNPLKDHVAKTKARPEFSLIALVCAGYEKTIQKDSWRNPGQTAKDYLNQLVLWGYTAAEVEKLIIDHQTDAD
ncbi:ParB family chromosome partitioning protein [Arthrobacter sp. GAS37]|uniref:ParB/RepB/Spo0J family partition protein n=1 Tax=Arthrobacter sp. GAS37 TaxID=3156261 RepID=UPI00383786FC